jgi:hypothetical protein
MKITSSKAYFSVAYLMSDMRTIDLFVEDRAHEEFLKALVQRLAREASLAIEVRVRSARGGHGLALKELGLYQHGVEKGLAGLTQPDVLVVGIDANCRPFSEARKSVEDSIAPAFKNTTAIACPDPHVERWYLADPESFKEAVGKQPRLGRKKCERDLYKNRLAQAVAAAGHPPTLGGLEFAQDIVEAMDLYRAGKNERSLKHFLDDIRKVL